VTTEDAVGLRATLSRLHDATWTATALALALRDPSAVDPALRAEAERVMAALGLTDEVAAVLADGTAVGAAAEAAAAVLQGAAVLSGTSAWRQQDDEALLAQGRASAQAALMFKMFVVPSLDGLEDLINAEGALMLDVGVGVAAMAIEYCRAFPTLRVVGLDVFPRALALARANVAEAGLEDRIELREQDVATLTDENSYELAWLPAPFVPPAPLREGLVRMAACLRPGGWLVIGHGRFRGEAVDDALSRLKTTAFSGTPLTDDEAQTLLRDAGLASVSTLPTPPGAPALTVGRRP
jgi:SAM-dependent methyltransferase